MIGTVGDLFGTPLGSPQADKLIEASVQWARKVMDKIAQSVSHTSW